MSGDQIGRLAAVRGDDMVCGNGVAISRHQIDGSLVENGHRFEAKFRLIHYGTVMKLIGMLDCCAC